MTWTRKEFPTIGRGKNMSIPKAALVFWFEDPEWVKFNPGFLHWGDLDAMHKIVDIAGARQCSFLTPAQVSAQLAVSSYWEKDFHPCFYPGMRSCKANMYKPSEKGKLFYEKYLRNRHENKSGSL